MMIKTHSPIGLLYLFISVLLLATSFPAFSGFTLDESVLSECEREHPNDPIARLVCNNRLDGIIETEKAKQIAFTCNLKAIGDIKAEKPTFDSLMNEYADEDTATVIANLKRIGFVAEVMDQGETAHAIGEQKNKVVIFRRETRCNSRRFFLFDIRFNDQEKVEKFLAWNIDPENKADSIRIPELTWDRKENLAAIASANIIRDAAKKKREEEHRRQESEQKIKAESDAIQQNKRYPFVVGVTIFLSIAVLIVIWIIFKFESKKAKSNSDKEPSPAQRAYSRSRPEKLLGVKQDQPTYPKIPDTQHPDPNKTSKSNRKNSEYTYSDYTNSFKEKYPFVTVNVLPSMQDQFIQECLWLQKRTGHFPSTVDQQTILDSINPLIG